MLQELLDAKQQYLSHFFDHLDLEQANKILNQCLSCEGTIFFSGIGKSGLVAKKIAATLAATGSKSHFLCPVDALHGDIGLVDASDIVILLSKSGETDELLNLIPHLQAKKACLIGVASNPSSRLVKACQLSIDLPLKQELCPFDLAPTTSTTIQMIFGDLLAMAMMQQKQFTIQQYALNHPAGRIGKRAALKVEDLMLVGAELPICKPQELVLNILVELSNKRCGCVLVVSEDNQLLGIFTDGDLRRSIEKFKGAALEKPLEELMTRSPKWITPDILLWDAMKLMENKAEKKEIMVLPVLTDDKKVVGLIKLHDIIQAGL
jgi:arabinose-5-phosphate isomerase